MYDTSILEVENNNVYSYLNKFNSANFSFATILCYGYKTSIQKWYPKDSDYSIYNQRKSFILN